MRNFLSFLWSLANVAYECVPVVLRGTAEYLKRERQEQRRQQLHNRIMRRLLRNPSSLDVLRERMETNDLVEWKQS